VNYLFHLKEIKFSFNNASRFVVISETDERMKRTDGGLIKIKLFKFVLATIDWEQIYGLKRKKEEKKMPTAPIKYQ
jgi:hypothetical protein